MADCSDNIYYILYTDKSISPISVLKSALDQTTVDITLLGKTRFEYGEVFNENMLHLLENFASLSMGSGEEDAPPFLPYQTYAGLLNQPSIGQLWYDETLKILNVRNVANDTWLNIADSSMVAGNSGYLAHGESIPLPVAANGYVFSYGECVWNVSPCYLSNANDITAFDISADDGVISAAYTTSGGSATGLVEYVIIGIKSGIGITDYSDAPC